MNIPTVLFFVVVATIFIYSQFKKHDFLKEWTQFADENQFQFDNHKSSLTGMYREYEIWIGPEKSGIYYSRSEQNSDVAFDTAIWLALYNPGRLILGRVTKLTLNGENEFTALLANAPQVQTALAELKTSNWVIRVQDNILKYTQHGVEHDTTRLFSTIMILANLADVIEALPVSHIKIDPLQQYPGYQ